jgi:hypothetical protein
MLKWYFQNNSIGRLHTMGTQLFCSAAFLIHPNLIFEKFICASHESAAFITS